MNTELIDNIAKQRDEVIEICAQTQAILGKALDQRDELRTTLAQAVRYIEVQHAYSNTMTAEQVEKRILENANIAEVEIGANSCNTLAKFDFVAARAALAKVPK